MNAATLEPGPMYQIASLPARIPLQKRAASDLAWLPSQRAFIVKQGRNMLT
jgi:hypothetical protein